jgi:hypothetical protein
MNKQIKILLTGDDVVKFDAIKKSYGVQADSETIRILIHKEATMLRVEA